MNATLTFLGTGTSMGVPTLGCGCAVCTSAVTPPPAGDPRNRRTRPSVHIAWHSEGADHAVLIDTGPDFHAQAIRERVTHVDAVFYTHPHADHILGLDDLRPLTFALVDPLPLYVDEQTAAVIERIFDYTFRPPTRGTTIARVALNRLKESDAIHLFGASFQRIPVNHGNLVISGYRFGSAAYLTDRISTSSFSTPSASRRIRRTPMSKTPSGSSSSSSQNEPSSPTWATTSTTPLPTPLSPHTCAWPTTASSWAST
jgi:phosphoribosyl 1,2-cyclic phosphate phosphodiesterase